MIAFLGATAGLVLGISLGFVLGWASRRHAHWCPQCGNPKTCPIHDPTLREITRTGHAAGRVPAGLLIPLRDGNSGPGGHLEH